MFHYFTYHVCILILYIHASNLNWHSCLYVIDSDTRIYNDLWIKIIYRLILWSWYYWKLIEEINLYSLRNYSRILIELWTYDQDRLIMTFGLHDTDITCTTLHLSVITCTTLHLSDITCTTLYLPGITCTTLYL